MNVFPPRNLPGDSENWGRHVEGRIEDSERTLNQLNQSTDNAGRFTGGQLEVFGGQIQEQFDRSTMVVRPADLSVTGNQTIEPFPRATRTVTFPNPGGRRAAQVEIYVDHDNQNFGNVGIFVSLSYQGRIISKLTWMQQTDEVAFFTGVPTRGSGMANVVLPDSGAAEFLITLTRVGFTSTTTTETLTNIQVYLTPFQSTV